MTPLRMLRLLWVGLKGLAAIVVLYAVGAVIGAVFAKPGEIARPTTGNTTKVLLVAGLIHHDFLLPLDQTTRQHFALLEKAGIDTGHPDARWLVIGWGARDFYTTTGTYGDLQISSVVKGMFGDRSVMRVDLAGRLPDAIRTRALSLTDRQYSALLKAISASFQRDDLGQPIALNIAGFSSTDMFFKAQGRFDLLRNCNSWVGRMLRASGLRFGRWTPTPFAVSLSHWLHQSP